MPTPYHFYKLGRLSKHMNGGFMQNVTDYKSGSNLTKLTIVSYILTCVTGISVILPFVLKNSAATYFHTDLAYMGFVFSFFMIGMLSSEFLNGFIVKFLSLKQEIYTVGVVYAICVILLFMTKELALVMGILFIIGFCFGITTTMPNFIIVHAFDGAVRSTKLNRLDFFFSVGSSGYPLIAAWMISSKFSWQSVYLSVIIIFIILFVLCKITIFPNMNAAEEKTVKVDTSFSKWNLSVYLMGMVILLYFMSYVGFTYWVPEYLTKFLHISESKANFGITLFWIFYAVGCYISSFAVRKIPVNKYIIISTIVALISYYAIYISANAAMMLISISVLGLGCATVYSSSISYGTLLIDKPSPRLVGFFIFTSGVGTWLGEAYSSFIVAKLGVPAILFISAVMMLACTLIMVFLAVKNRGLDVSKESLH